MSEKKTKFFSYKGLPLVRKENTIYYGNMTDKYVAMLQIMDVKQVGEINVATKVNVQLLLTDDEVRLKDRIIKKADKESLYDALDIACIWLERTRTSK